MQNARNDTAVQWASGLNVIAGLWLLISPWVLGFSNMQAAMWDAVIVGVVVAVLAAIRAFGAYRATWLSWINVILGLWLIVAPWVLTFSTDTTMMWNSVITGIVVAVLGAWSAVATSQTATTVG